MSNWSGDLNEAAGNLVQEDAELLAALMDEGSSSVPPDLTKKGDKPAYGFERGGEAWMAMRHKGSTKGSSDRMERRYKHLEKRGLVKRDAEGKIEITKRGQSAVKKYEKGMVDRDNARRTGQPISAKGKSVKLKKGEHMVFGRIVGADGKVRRP
jgi:hypothetical protein